MMGEAREVRPPSSIDDGGASQIATEDSSLYLTALQKSLIYELTTRKTRIASASSRADFWQKYQEEGLTNRFNADVLDEGLLDSLIKERRGELARLKESKQLKTTILEAADAAHVINQSMAAYPPVLQDVARYGPLSRLPLRYLAAKRDNLALEYLAIDTDVKQVRTERQETGLMIEATRKQTSSLVEEVKRRAKEFQQERTGSLQSNAKATDKNRKLNEALETARGKREMVKGVLRGLILESGLDWYGNRELRELMLELGDEDLNASEDEPDFDTDSEGDS